METSDATIELYFRPLVFESPFHCGEKYPRGEYEARPIDLQFFVHDIRLVTDDGSEHKVDIVDEGPFQGSGVALLDFEDAMGHCMAGTVAQNKTIKGRIAASSTAERGAYTGLRFRIGVPPELDRMDPSTLSPPLGSSKMQRGRHVFFSAWGMFVANDTKENLSYPDVGIDLQSEGCSEDLAGLCTDSNRPEIELDGFDLDKSMIVVDWGALFGDLELPMCPPSGPCGCDSPPSGPVCDDLMSRLGLGPASSGPSGQTVFRLE